METLNGSKVVVIGGSSGIGLAVAKQALADGAEVTIASRNIDKLNRANKLLGDKASIETVDATSAEAVQQLYARVGNFDHLAVTTHDAGEPLSGAMRPLADIDLDLADKYFRSRFWAKFLCTKFAIPYLSERGSIVLTSGVVARGYVPNHSLLAGNNAAVESFARKVAIEIGPKRINVVSPGLTQGTETYLNVPDDAEAAMISFFKQNLPVQFVATADDIAPTYLFCMRNSYMTGVFIDVDGGFNVWDPEKQKEGSFEAH